MSTHLVTGYGGREHVTAADDGSKNAGIVGTESYVLNTGSKFEAEVVSNNLIKIKDGDAIQKGRHWKIAKKDYVELTIDNGLQGLKRHDLIVARYFKNPDTGVEGEELAVIKGTSSENPVIQEYETGDIYDGDLIDEMPLYRVELDGLSIINVTPLFNIIVSMENHYKTIANSKNAGHVKVDEFLSDESSNPVQNKTATKAIHNLEKVTHKYYSEDPLQVPIERGEFKLEQNQYMMLGQRIMILQLCLTVKNVGTGLAPWTEFKLTDIKNIKLSATMNTHVVSDTGNKTIRLSINNNGELFLNTLGYILDNNRAFRTIFTIPLANSCWLN